MSNRSISSSDVNRTGIIDYTTSGKSYVASIDTTYDVWQGGSSRYCGYGNTPEQAIHNANKEYHRKEYND
jgi:hypothetical protein